MKSLPTTIAARRRPSYGRVRSGTRPPPPPRSTGRARAAPQYSQSKVRASGSAAAAREAALSAEVVELNRTSVTHLSELLDFVIVIALAHP